MLKKISLMLLLSVLLTAGLPAQSRFLPDDQRPKAKIESIEIEPNPVGRGDIFTLTIDVDWDNALEVDLDLDDFTSDFTKWRGPYMRSFIDSTSKDDVRRKVRITTTFRAVKSGRQIFPSLTVTAGSYVMQTEPLLIRVGLYANRKLYMPLEVEWTTPAERIYAGEAIPLFLMVRNQETVSIFDRTRVATPRDGFLEEAGDLGEITLLEAGDIVLYDIPAEAFIFTSPVSGRVTIPAAGVDQGGITGWSSDFNLDILPIPEEILSTGAVGSFSLSSEISSDKIYTGDEIRLTSRVSGTGNQNFMKIPDPEVQGLVLVSTEEIPEYSYTSTGYSGSKTVQYIYTAEEPGAASVRVPEFPYLDRDSGRVVTIPAENFTVAVSPVPAAGEASEDEMIPLVKIEDESRGLRWKSFYMKPEFYLWLLPGPFFLILFSFVKGRRLIISLVITVIIMVVIVSVTNAFFSTKDSGVPPGNAVSYYNTALERIEEHQYTSALHELRLAVYTDPLNSQYRDALDWLEDKMGFVNPVTPAFPYHPDIFFFVLILSFNLLAVGFVLRKVIQSGTPAVIIILMSAVILLSTGFMLYGHISRTRLTGIIMPKDSYIKKIPDESAGDWLRIEQGIPVRLKDESGIFTLIETGDGIKGWISRDKIRLDRAD